MHKAERYEKFTKHEQICMLDTQLTECEHAVSIKMQNNYQCDSLHHGQH